MKLERFADFSTSDPERLRKELRQEHAAVRDALMALDRDKAARPKVRISDADTVANFDEHLLLDTTTASVTASLPAVTVEGEGRSVFIGRKSTSNTAKVASSDGATVNGATSVNLTASIGFRQFQLVDGNWYGHHT